MKELKNILLEFSKINITENNGWYNWCVNENHLPKGIILPDGNNYGKNISLKKQLHTLWKNEKNETIKGNLIEYYIVKWGGIKTNGGPSLNIYKIDTSEKLILRGSQGKAS